MTRFQTKQEADADALRYFELRHQERQRRYFANAEVRAAGGDMWCLGQLGLAALDGNELAAVAESHVLAMMRCG